MLLPPSRLEEIRKRAEAASPGPWTYDGPHGLSGSKGEVLAVMAGQLTVAMVGFDRGDPVAEAASRADAALLASCRTDIPALLASHEALEAENKRLREEARSLWHFGHGGAANTHKTCSICADSNPYRSAP